MSDPNFSDGAPPLDPGAFAGMDETAPEPVAERTAPRKTWWLVAAGVVLLAAVALGVASYKVLSEPPPKPAQPENVPQGDEPKPPKPPPKVVPPTPPTPKDEGTSALRLASAKGQIALPTLVASDIKPLTIEAWLLNEARELRVFVKTKTGIWVLVRTADPAAPYRVTHFAGSEGTVRTYDAPAPAAKWSHVAVVITDDQPTLFVDGKPLAAKPAPMVRDKAAPQWASGVGTLHFPADATAPQGGTLLALRVSQSARYAKEFAPPPSLDADKDALALYRFAEGKGEATQDLTGNGHTGQLEATEWVRVKPEDGGPVAPPKK